MTGIGNLNADRRLPLLTAAPLNLSQAAADAKFPASWHGVYGIENQVQKDLLEMVGVGLHAGQVTAVQPLNGDVVVLQLFGAEVQHAVQHGDQVRRA